MIVGMIWAIYSPCALRKTHGQSSPRQVPIAGIQFDPNERDDIPAEQVGPQAL